MPLSDGQVMLCVFCCNFMTDQLCVYSLNPTLSTGNNPIEITTLFYVCSQYQNIKKREVK